MNKIFNAVNTVSSVKRHKTRRTSESPKAADESERMLPPAVKIFFVCPAADAKNSFFCLLYSALTRPFSVDYSRQKIQRARIVYFSPRARTLRFRIVQMRFCKSARRLLRLLLLFFNRGRFIFSSSLFFVFCGRC